MTNSNRIQNQSRQRLSQKELYKIYRDYIKHEDLLIKNRLTWLLVAETLIFKAYSKILTDRQDLLLILFTLISIGLLVGILGFVGISASILSINALRDKGKAHITSSKLPELTGGGDKRTEFLGKFPQIGIPIIFTFAWFFLLLTSEISLFYVYSDIIIVSLILLIYLVEDSY